jgi:hypothetical protein
VQYRWATTIAGFNMPVRLSGGEWLMPTMSWQKATLAKNQPFEVDKNFYINLRKL